MDITDRQTLEHALAETYAQGWDRVADYREVRAASSHPDRPVVDVVRSRGLSKNVAYDWSNDKYAPDPVKAIHKADDRGWLDLDWTEPPFTGLNVLVAWVFAGGSINQLYEPAWTVRQREHTPLETAFYEAGLTMKAVHQRSEKRTAEYRPSENAALVGRFLVALGAPRGKKARQRISLPAYLDDAPYMARLDFARAYVYHRGTLRPDKPASPVQIGETRNVEYIDELGAFFRDVVGNPDWIRASGDSMLLLRRRAAAMLCAEPLFGDWL